MPGKDTSYPPLSSPSGGKWPRLLSPCLSLGFGVFRDFFLSPLLQLPHISIHPTLGQQSLVPGARREV